MPGFARSLHTLRTGLEATLLVLVISSGAGDEFALPIKKLGMTLITSKSGFSSFTKRSQGLCNVSFTTVKWYNSVGTHL